MPRLSSLDSKNSYNVDMDVRTNLRKILHVYMDAFYASVEQRDDPTLLTKPVVVGGKPNSRGVVCLPIMKHANSEYTRLCPWLRLFGAALMRSLCMSTSLKYHEVSLQIRQIVLDYTPIVEPLSLDDAFLDVTGPTSLFGPVDAIAFTIKQRIQQERPMESDRTVKFIGRETTFAQDLCFRCQSEISGELRPFEVKFELTYRWFLHKM